MKTNKHTNQNEHPPIAVYGLVANKEMVNRNEN
jgi:hypothetical protein